MTIRITVICLLAVLSGCGLRFGNPVPPAPPPAPEVSFVRGETTTYLSRKLQRDAEGKVTGMKSLARAEAVVASASKQPLVEKVSANQMEQARSNLNEAQSIWAKIKPRPLANAKSLAQVDHLAYMATRWAEIAIAEVGVESGLDDLAQVQQQLRATALEEQRSQQADERWLGQQLVPAQFGGIRFAVGTAKLTADSQPVVRRLAAFLDEHPQYGIEIAGHTDNVPPSPRNLRKFLNSKEQMQTRSEAELARAYNLDVSERRAGALAAALLDEGVARERLAVRGYGQSRPVADNNGPEGRRANRRVTATVIPAVTDGPNPE